MRKERLEIVGWNRKIQILSSSKGGNRNTDYFTLRVENWAAAASGRYWRSDLQQFVGANLSDAADYSLGECTLVASSKHYSVSS